jgi:hypothetical protein
MKFTARCRYVVGVLVDPSATDMNDDLLKNLFISFMHTASGGSTIPPDMEKGTTVIIWRENAEHRSYKIGDASIQAMPVHVLEIAIQMIENKKAPVLFSQEEDGLVLLFAVGSQDFCRAFIHFVATNDDGTAKNWGMHYLRKLANAPQGVALWYDTATPKDFFYDEITSLIETFVEDIRA